MLTIRVKSELDKHVRNAQRFRDALEKRETPLKKIKRRQINRWAKNFDSEGQIYGGWAALSPRWTVPERESQGYGGTGPILVREGTLRTHFVTQNEEGEVNNQAIQWNMTNRGGARGSFGATVSHHRGYPNPLPGRKAIPPRKLWDIDETDKEAAKDILEDWVEDIIKRYYGGA